MKMKKSFALLAMLLLVLGSTLTVHAASNPYPTTQDTENDGEGDGYYEIPCTYFAWQQAYDNLGIALPAWSHGGTWYASAQSAGMSVGSTPQVNSIAVWSGGTYGHVAYVTSVSSSTTFTVNEGGRTDLDTTDSHGVAYGYTLTNAVGDYRPYSTTLKLLGFIYLSSETVYNPQGCVDSITGGTGQISVRGWAFDKSDLSSQLRIDVYIGGPAGSGTGSSIYANKQRTDVDDVYGCGDYHGFEADISTNLTGSQTVYIYAINVGTGDNTCLGSKTVEIEAKPKIENFKVLHDSDCEETHSDIMPWHEIFCDTPEDGYTIEFKFILKDSEEVAYSYVYNGKVYASYGGNIHSFGVPDYDFSVTATMYDESDNVVDTSTVTHHVSMVIPEFEEDSLKVEYLDDDKAKISVKINQDEDLKTASVKLGKRKVGDNKYYGDDYSITDFSEKNGVYEWIYDGRWGELGDIPTYISLSAGNSCGKYAASYKMNSKTIIDISSNWLINAGQTEITLQVGETKTLSVSDTTTEDLFNGWCVVDQDVADIEASTSLTKGSASCNVTGKKMGETYVICGRQKTGYGYNYVGATYKIKVVNSSQTVSAQQVSVNSSLESHKIAAGKKIQLTASVSPSNATNSAVTWSSSNTKVATVDANGLVTFKKKSGGKSVIITATAADGSGVSVSYKIKSMKGVVKKISISGKKSVKAGKSLKLKAKVKASKGANKKVIWTSSNTAYATVNSKGKVKTYAAGKGKKVKITAMATDGSGKKKTKTIKIK